MYFTNFSHGRTILQHIFDAWAEHLWIFTLEHPSSIRIERRPFATLRSVSCSECSNKRKLLWHSKLYHWPLLIILWLQFQSWNIEWFESNSMATQKVQTQCIWPLSHRRFVASHDGEAACLQWWIHSKARQCIASGNNLSIHLQNSAWSPMSLQTMGAPCSFSVTQVYKHIFPAQLFQYLSFQLHNVNQVSPAKLSEKWKIEKFSRMK